MLWRVPGRSAALAVIALVSGSAGLGVTSAGASSPVCGPAAHTIASDSVARVYSRNGQVFGCAHSGSRSYRLGTMSQSLQQGQAGPIALAGVQVAYGLTSYGVDTATAQVLVRRLTDGHVERRRAAITGSVGPESSEQVDDVVVKRDDSVAWIAHVNSIPSGSHIASEVQKSDRTSRTLLDKEPSGIKLHSLRLDGSRLTWRYESTTRSTFLR